MYYLIINEQQWGPFAKEDLLAQGLTPSTMVWREGMADWAPATEVTELQELFYQQPAQPQSRQTQCAQPGQPPQQPYQQPYQQPQQGYQQPYQQPQQGYQQPYQQPYQQQGYPQQQYPQPPQQPQYPQYQAQPTNWLPWAIVATVLGLCSCIGLVLGIIAITRANSANKFYQIGDTVSGNAANSSARTLTIIALAFDGIGLLVNIAMLA